MDLAEFNELRESLRADTEMIAERAAGKALASLAPRVDALEAGQRDINARFARVAVVFSAIGAAVSALATWIWNRVSGE